MSAVGLFCCDKFEENPNKKVSDLSKLSKPYFIVPLQFNTWLKIGIFGWIAYMHG